MTNYAVSYHPAAAIEAAIEAVATTVEIQVIPISDGKEFMLIQKPATTP
jgi:glycerate kinase